MVDEGLVEEREISSEDSSGGPPRRYYRRTALRPRRRPAPNRSGCARCSRSRGRRTSSEGASDLQRRGDAHLPLPAARVSAAPSRRYAAEMIDALRARTAARRAPAIDWARCGSSSAAWLNAIIAGLGERRRQRRDGCTRPRRASRRSTSILAWRMMLRYPGLSIISVFGMAVGIAIAGGAFIGRQRSR